MGGWHLYFFFTPWHLLHRALLEKERQGKEIAERQRHDLELKLQAFEGEFDRARRELEASQGIASDLEGRIKQAEEDRKALEESMHRAEEARKAAEEAASLEKEEREKREEEARQAQEEMEARMEEARLKEQEAQRLQEELLRTQQEMEEKQKRLQEAINTPRQLHVSEHDDDDDVEKGVKSRAASEYRLSFETSSQASLTFLGASISDFDYL